MLFIFTAVFGLLLVCMYPDFRKKVEKDVNHLTSELCNELMKHCEPCVCVCVCVNVCVNVCV